MPSAAPTYRPLPPLFRWTWQGRLFTFILAAASIWCLLAEFYGLCSMRNFTFAILIPCTFVLIATATVDGLRGDGQLARAVIIGSVAGFIAAIAYDVFRLPFVFAREWHLAAVVPPMDLFKVFPRFGALILGQPVNQPRYSLAAQLIGWAYHFSNGITFGVMYTAMLGRLRGRTWWWGVAMAVGLELAMLFTPYTRYFAIPLTALFVAVTLTAHLIFGTVMGLWARGMAVRWPGEGNWPGLSPAGAAAA